MTLTFDEIAAAWRRLRNKNKNKDKDTMTKETILNLKKELDAIPRCFSAEERLRRIDRMRQIIDDSDDYGQLTNQEISDLAKSRPGLIADIIADKRRAVVRTDTDTGFDIWTLPKVSAPVPAPTPTPKAPTQEVFYLPRESGSGSELDAVYGKAAREMDNRLAHFNWPKSIVARLYDRGGSRIVDHTDDGLADHRTHVKLASRLEAALEAIYQAIGKAGFEKEGWHVYGGSHNYRQTTTGGRLSIHSWAAAIDFNPTENGFRSQSTTFSDFSINIMERHGFLAAGRAWVSTPDWQHFQAAIPYISKGSYYDINGLPAWIKPLSEKP